jgi:hypothetical protein
MHLTRGPRTNLTSRSPHIVRFGCQWHGKQPYRAGLLRPHCIDTKPGAGTMRTGKDNRAMCGIVGLFAKDAALEAELGAHLATMLASMSDRGPDSAGFAVYAPAIGDAVKLTLRGPAGYDFAALAAGLRGRLGGTVGIQPRGTHAVLAVPRGEEAVARCVLASIAPELVVVGAGRRMELYKEVGAPPGA